MRKIRTRITPIKDTFYAVLIKTKRNREEKITHMLLERKTFYFSFNKNRELKIKLGTIETCEREKSAFF